MASEGATNETQLAHQDIDLLQASKAILRTCQWCESDRGYCQLCHFQRQMQPEIHWVVWKMFLSHLKLQLDIQFLNILQNTIIGHHERDSWTLHQILYTPTMIADGWRLWHDAPQHRSLTQQPFVRAGAKRRSTGSLTLHGTTHSPIQKGNVTEQENYREETRKKKNYCN